MPDDERADAMREARQAWEAALRLSRATPGDGAPAQADPRIDTQPIYSPADLADVGFDYLRDVGFPGQYPFTRGIHPSMYRGAPVHDAPVRWVRLADETNRASATCRSRAWVGINVAFDLPTQHGYDSDDPRARGEVGMWASPSTPSATSRRSSTASRSMRQPRQRHQCPGRDDPRHVRGAGRAAGRAARAPDRLHAERHSEGVHRARHLRLPPGALAPPRHRRHRVLPPSTCRGGISSTSAATTCARRAAPSSTRSRSRSPTPSPTWRRWWRAGCAVDASPRGSRSTSRPAPHPVRRRRSSAPCGGCGHGSCASASAPRSPELRLPHRRRLWGEPAHGPAAGEQHRPDHPHSMSRSWGAPSRSTPPPTTRRWRCPPSSSVKLALRTQQILAHEAGLADVVDPLAGSYYVETMTNQIEEAARA